MTTDTINFNGKKLTRRYRKTSATWVLYYRGRIVESGFDDESAVDWYVTLNPNTIWSRIAVIESTK